MLIHEEHYARISPTQHTHSKHTHTEKEVGEQKGIIDLSTKRSAVGF